MESKHSEIVKIDINSLHEMIVKLQESSESQAIKIEKLEKKVEEKDKEITELKEENKKLEKENQKLKKDIQDVISYEIQNIVSTTKKTKTPRKKYRESDSEQTSVTDSDSESDKTFESKCVMTFESRSEPRDLVQGFIDTFTFFSDSDRSKSQKLKEYACYGKNKELSEEARKNNNVINGRGTPDSIFSRFKEFYDKTPLMVAAECGNLQAVKELVKNGANVNLWDRDKHTALDYADHNHHWKVSEFLRGQKALTNVQIDELKNELPDMTEKFKL